MLGQKHLKSYMKSVGPYLCGLIFKFHTENTFHNIIYIYVICILYTYSPVFTSIFITYKEQRRGKGDFFKALCRVRM